MGEENSMQQTSTIHRGKKRTLEQSETPEKQDLRICETAFTLYPIVLPSTLEPNPYVAPPPHSWKAILSTHLAQDLTKEDMKACIDLIRSTSMRDYQRSKQGWNLASKKKEMEDRSMRYLLVRLVPGIENDNPNNDGESISSARSSPSKKRLPCPIPTPVNPSSVSTNVNGLNPIHGFPRPPHTALSGFMSFKVEWDDPPNEDRRVIYIYEVHLAQELRGGGMGRHLFAIIDRVARAIGVSKIMLTVFVTNTQAIAFYETLGFGIDSATPSLEVGPGGRKTRSGTSNTMYGDYWIMSKELASD
ncbi:acyl-CoA N-acyltransferase [Dendryphion nanum]|uniref:N-alpha-acetyltransferase 40 n=1 Tax=Dendryphion nanum TaxID=256645 RepID=A0A9P9E4Q4_9PLEO|nr:acyl-CoA N-acyltransferase [Dendryphion nanum]